MADATQEVETVLKVKDQATAAHEKVAEAAEHAAKATEHVEHATEHLGHAHQAGAHHAHGLEHAFEGVRESGEHLHETLLELAAAVGVATTLKGAWEKFIETNAETETATRNLGASFAGLYQYSERVPTKGLQEGIEHTGQAMGRFEKLDPVANLNEGLKRSAELMEKFADASFELGIPKKQLSDMAKSLGPAVASAGKGTDDLGKLTLDLAKVARGTGNDFAQSSEQLSHFIQFGMARPTGLLAQLGISSKIGHEMSRQQRLAMVMSKIQLMRPDDLAQIKTFDDLMNIVRARAEEIFEIAGKPLFEKAKVTVKELGEWIEKNREKIQQTVSLVADKLLTGLKTSVEIIEAIYRNWDKVKVAVEAIVAIMAVKKASSWAKEFASSVSLLTSKAAELHSIKLGQGMGTAAAEEMGGGPGMAKAGGALGKAGALAMLAESFAIGYAIGTAINGYLEKQPWWNKLWTPTDSAETRAKNLAMDLQSKREDAEHAANQKKLIESAKDLTVSENSPYAGSPEGLLQHWLQRARAGERIAVAGNQAGAGEHDVRVALDTVLKEKGLYVPPKGGGTPKELKKETEAKGLEVAKNMFDFRGSRFDITQNFAEGFDADRIAVTFGNDLARLGEIKSQSGFAPLFGAH